MFKTGLTFLTSCGCTRKLSVLSFHKQTSIIQTKSRLLTCHQKQFSSSSDSDKSSHQSSSDSDKSSRQSTYDEDEVKKFSRMAKSWWNEAGDAAALHTLNKLRVPFIRDCLLQQQSSSSHPTNCPLEGLRILDVGCGGGVLAEPLARIGARVHGVDALEATIDTARWHARLDPTVTSKVAYSCCLVEDVAEMEPHAYDAVICSEIIEHVADPMSFISACSKLLKSGGSMFITTISKTKLSYALAIAAGEYVFNIVPRGTHDWNKFLTPDDLQLILKSNNLHTQLIHGMCLNPITLKWSWIKDVRINYALHAIKDR